MKRKRRPYKQALSPRMILAWADEYFEDHGTWPHLKAGPIKGTLSETWRGVDFALNTATRGLKVKQSLTAFLRQHRNVFLRHEPFTEDLILEWAKAFHRKTGKWPEATDRMVIEGVERTWNSINLALINGRRGLPGGSSLKAFFKKRGIHIEYKKPGRPPGQTNLPPAKAAKHRRKK